MKRITPLLLLLAVVAGCTSMRWNPEEHGVAVDRVPSDYVEVPEIHMDRDKKGITIYGEVSPRHITADIQSGHVYIELITGDGTTVFETGADLHRLGKPLKRNQRYSFSAAMPITPSAGSRIRIKFEENP